ncbi:phage neck terminator protein [Paenibacillus sp. FSL K6-1558]|uniref:phage neck terminator protein n=1 Tax=Paenibacillus sp. FSL K6-1558 TaxID=2921473 RepID=UPI0030F80330
MIQFEAIRKIMIEGLSAAIGVRVIEIDGVNKVPPVPFMSYDFSDESGVRGHMAVTLEDNKMVHTGDVTLSVTFQSYAHDRLGAVVLANRARDWLLTSGHRLLKDEVNTVVVTVGESVKNDVQIGTEWERRNAFEIELRTKNVIEEDYTPIESVNVEGVEPIG